MSFRRPQIIIPRAEGGYVDGRWLEGAPAAPHPISASVQPASAGDYQQLEAENSGRRIRAAVRIYTNATLNVAGQDWRNGDRLVWDKAPMPGEYMLVGVSPWQSAVIPHYRYLAVLLTE